MARQQRRLRKDTDGFLTPKPMDQDLHRPGDGRLCQRRQPSQRRRHLGRVNWYAGDKTSTVCTSPEPVNLTTGCQTTADVTAACGRPPLALRVAVELVAQLTRPARDSQRAVTPFSARSAA